MTFLLGNKSANLLQTKHTDKSRPLSQDPSTEYLKLDAWSPLGQSRDFLT